MTRLLRQPPDGEPSCWFEAGVRFRCLGTECGDCCSGKHGAGAVWIDNEEVEQLARHLGLTSEELRHRYLRNLNGRASLRERANLDCIFYRPGDGCSIYDARPLQCRTYPFWGRILATRAAWEIESENCPGIDYDDARVSGEEVRARLALDARRHQASATTKLRCSAAVSVADAGGTPAPQTDSKT